jgi:uncharacterized membrane protein
MGGLGSRPRAPGEWRDLTRVLLRGFVREIPILIGIWVLVAGALAGWSVISVDMSLRESIALALGFLPMSVPLSPLVWLRWEFQAWQLAALPALGIGCLWFVVTLPLAAILGLLLASLVGGDASPR